MDEATAFWVERPGVGALKAQRLPEPGERDVVVRTMHSAVSRGTETTVFTGHVPASERERMRAPFQEGEFGGPVKYGYLNVGRVVEGPQSLRGRVVFTLYPHQSAFVVPADAVVPVPDGVPARRAVLAGAVETAVNVLWDAAPLVGDRITVIGAGMIGCCIARLAQALPGSDVILIDTDESRRAIASRLGAGFATSNAATGRDVVINASGSADGLQLALELAVTEGR
ncbi:hypothetical protein GCM10025867_43110 [Frondihabitans sucicola]|uniref:Dehydrogenase n=1 Tax=Frondihabitans sucicola TaxID=1268041 RepID=A0ABN6Y7U4_9MICO|nr:zinc-binding alcohol dehydrogenase [Frondihabitans sucicola]BDZ52070.1 hypothetical protein GCM10025867_43110 [Frondihabitans sucicola]